MGSTTKILLNDSMKICRLCGKEQKSETISMFERSDANASDLKKEISFFLPIQVLETSPFPRGICEQCHNDFGVVSSFFVNLNEGQARLADILRQNENIHIYMPDWMSEKRTLFPAKYPAFERQWKKKRVVENSSAQDTSNKNVKSVTNSVKEGKEKAALEQGASKDKSTENQLEKALEEIFRDDDTENKNQNSSSGGRRRTRKLPKRLAESIQGNDLERIFKRESLDIDFPIERKVKETEVREHKDTPTHLSPSRLESSSDALVNPEVMQRENLTPSDSTSFTSRIPSIESTKDNGTELVIVKLNDPDSGLPSAAESSFSNNEVKIHIIDENLPQTDTEVSTEFKIQSESNISSFAVHSEKEVDDEAPSEQMETITLQVDENTQLEAIGAMLSELESNKPDKSENEKVVLQDDGTKGLDPKSIRIKSRPPKQAGILSATESVSSKKGKGRNRCDICFKSFRLTSKLAHHRSAAHAGVYFACSTNECSKQYKTKDALLLHQKMNGHTGIELYDPNPKKTRKTKKVTETSFKNYTCEECGKIFLQLWDLCEHRQQKHNQSASDTAKSSSEKDSDTYKCQNCSKTFKSKALLVRHSNVVHTNERPYECDLCHLKFKSSTNLKAHQSTHSEEKKFSCDSCGKLFAYKTSLIQHIKCQHEGQKAFRCPHCNKSFSQNGNLQEHIRIHTGHKPYTCEICGRKFTTSSQHRLHVKRHKGEKPWACQFCPKAFLHKESWTAHMRRHRGDRPFVCDFESCKKGFAELWALKKHMRLHTGEKPYICQLCPKSFSDCSNLAKHRKTHDKDVNASLYPVARPMLNSKSLDIAQLEGNIQNPEGQDRIHPTEDNDMETRSGLSIQQPSAKTQVWNILNEAANQAAASPTSMGKGLSAAYQPTDPGLSSVYTTEMGDQAQDEDVQQIIYITYDTDDKDMQVISEKTNMTQIETSSEASIQHKTEDVLSQLSAVASNLQPQSLVIPSPQSTEVSVEPISIGNQPRVPVPSESVNNWRVANENAIQEDAVASSSNVVIDNNVKNISQTTPTIVGAQEVQQIVDGNDANDEAGNVYVDIRLTDNELEQPIRLRVPPNFDPIAYATEYIQLHTAQSDSETVIPNQNLEQLEIQNVEQQEASENVSRSVDHDSQRTSDPPN